MWPLVLLIPLTVAPLGINSALFPHILAVVSVFVSYTYAPVQVYESAPMSTFPAAKIAYYACAQLVAPVSFCPNATDLACFCQNQNAFSTMAYCFQEGHREQVGGLLHMCNGAYNMSLDEADFARALDRYHHSATKPDNSSHPAQAPVWLPSDRIALFRDSYDQFLGNYNRSIAYGWLLVLFWALVFFSAAVANWTKRIAPGVSQRATGRLSRAWRAKVSLPALWGRKKTAEVRFLRYFDFLAPTRAELLILAAFAGLTAVLCVHQIRYIDGGPFFRTKVEALLRYYAVRTGILASYLLPFLVLFAGRNNVLQWVSGWDYSVFVMFHRWISRVTVLLLVAHSVGYRKHILHFFSIEGYVWFGALGTVCGVAILVQGLLVLRRRFYEAFLALHIVLAAGFMLGAWLHVQDLRFLAFYYFSVCLWVADRLFRIQRICTFGFPKASVELFEDDTLKVKVPIPLGFSTEGGGHCFVHFLRWRCFWQSHPFTYTVIGDRVVFYVKAKDGITRRLRSYLLANPGKCATVRIAVEGSYGEATPAHRYAHSVFLAGGNGIPGIFAEAVETSRRSELKRTGLELERMSASVHLIWVVREYHSALWFSDELKSLANLPIKVDVYLTKPTDKTPLLKPESFELQSRLPHVTFHSGRPNLRNIVANEVSMSTGATCFVACGHPIMVDDLRAEVVDIVRSSTKRVDYFEQLQVWA